MAAYQEVVEGDPHRILRLAGTKPPAARWAIMVTVIATMMIVIGLALIGLGFARWLEQRPTTNVLND